MSKMTLKQICFKEIKSFKIRTKIVRPKQLDRIKNKQIRKKNQLEFLETKTNKKFNIGYR